MSCVDSCATWRSTSWWYGASVAMRSDTMARILRNEGGGGGVQVLRGGQYR